MPFPIVLQIVTRAFLCFLIISIRIFAHLVVKAVPQNYWFYATLILLTLVLFVAMSYIESDESALDMRELCLYNAMVYGVGLVLYLSKIDPSWLMIGLTDAATYLIFGRLLWLSKNKEKNQFVNWPVFGVLGWYAQRIKRNVPMSIELPNARQATAAYLFILSCLAAGFILPLLGFKIAIAHVGFIAFIVTPFVAKRVLADMKRQHAAYLKSLDDASSARELVIVEQARADAQQEIAAEKERHNQQLAAKNTELHVKNLELAQAKADAERAREEAVQAREEAEHAKANEETISRALRTAAHDLRQNIALIGFAGHEIVRASSLAEKEEALEAFYDVNFKVTQAIEQLMYYAKLTTKAAQPKLEALEMCSTLFDLCTQWRNAGFEKGVEALIAYPRRGRVERYVACDPMLVNHVLQNLVINAILHGGDGCDRVVLCVRSRADHYLVQIRDCGQGIEEGEGPDQQANFLAFAQRVYERGTQRGDGQGLAMKMVK